ncbi:hypothetical protein ACF09L_33085 [Streptomyces sp. NPDC014779]|uniref:hypothetical protein n=1 Tax=unclassified Streptomyces TaxID=2593676 RepID=UPI0033C86FC3
MPSRREAVPFAFVAETEQFRSNVTPPPKERLTASQYVGRALLGLTVVAGLVGSLVFGMPALGGGDAGARQHQSEASEDR